MKRSTRALAATALVDLALALAGCGHTQSGPSVSACKTAMRSQYATALATGKPQGAEPAACKGLPASTLTELAGQIIGGN